MEIFHMLLAWYDENRRDLPWRGEKDPYRIWVSEIMLQQTRVETVRRYYDRFLQLFPAPAALAGATEESVLKAWEGLGYYSRARKLQDGARQITTEYGGRLPGTYDELIRIRGIGPYTAGAIASIAFGERQPAVDGNALRVFSRLFGLKENMGSEAGKRRVREIMREEMHERHGDCNQAVMDLGSLICLPRNPSCESCPLQGKCVAWRDGLTDSLPVLPVRKKQQSVSYALLIMIKDDMKEPGMKEPGLVGHRAVLVQKRKEKLLQGLWVFPMLEGQFSEEAVGREVRNIYGIHPHDISYRGQARHVFTHLIWEMDLWVIRFSGDFHAGKGIHLASRGDLERLAMPTAVRRAREVAGELLSDQILGDSLPEISK
ncbi:MAG: A/G-specific adenine glycosylase [Clostridia bacterium]|nr:A/G-specific adenine glycosylase [Clostridia bacterium]